MTTRTDTPTYELFFVLEAFHTCFAEYVAALRPLADELGDELLGCDGYYRESTDVALLALRFDERSFGADRLRDVLDFAGGAGIAALDPAKLPDRDRKRFYNGYLQQYPLRADDHPAADAALFALGETLGLRVPMPRMLTQRVVRVRPPTADVDTNTAVPSIARRLPLPPPGLAKARGKRREPTAQPAPAPVARPRDEFPPEPPTRQITPPPRPLPAPVPTAVDEIPTQPTDSPELAPPPPPRRYPRASSAPPPRRQDTATVRRPTPQGSAPPGVARPPGSAPPSSSEPPIIHARFRRGDEWVPARLRSLSLKGAYLACGAPPRLHDDVHIALGLDQQGTVMRGNVVHVTDADESDGTGASGFGVLFPTTESPARRQLRELLRVAQTRGVVLDPPPSRRHVRFPVRWPVCFALRAQPQLDLSALDVSQRGLFVATMERLPAGTLDFSLLPEAGMSPIRGRARVAREVPWKMACSRGLTTGFGLEITDFAPRDRERYEAFVERIGQRARRRVVVGASPERTEALVAGLSSAGYSVTGTSDPNALVQLVECDARPPDVAVLCSTLTVNPDAVRRLEQVLGSRKVPLISIQGEAPPRTRAVVDDLLHVGR